MIRFFLILFFTFIILEVSGQTSDTNFVKFWTSFHKDIIAKDYKALSSKTKFPLKAQGDLDYDTEDKYDQKDFVKVFSKFLSAEIPTHRKIRYDWLKNFKLSPEKKSQDKLIQIEAMVFEKIKGQWWLTLIYDGHSKY